MKTWEREDRIRRESMEKGREEGWQEKTKAVIQNMLNHGMPEEEICELVNCTQELIKEARK